MKMLTAQELAPLVGRSPKWLWSMMRTGKIKSVKMGKFRLSSEQWVMDSFEQAGETRQAHKAVNPRPQKARIDYTKASVKEIVKHLRTHTPLI